MIKNLLIPGLLLALSGQVQAETSPHWTYEGKAGPAHWAELNPDFVVCHSGKFQSPIDIRSAVSANLPALDLNFHTAAETLVNNGHTIQITVDDDEDFLLDGERFKLVQYHFHTPSENLIAGKQYPLEAHFVHINGQGELAVVAVMFVIGAENIALNSILPSIPSTVNKVVNIGQRIDLTDLFPAKRHYYRFSGSLTTPPCTEGLRWLIMKQPVTLSAMQLTIFQKALKQSNNRPVQPLHGRQIVE
ncbi:carbonic anhydrase family protein [Pantoea sp.]|uniref:carbonic anhydrase n=1 Tax=Pantoea sp. TaxID=69393 RepID=UPI00289D32EB|nr:carbonic anhydrase family protein [Pantoea sp.]